MAAKSIAARITTEEMIERYQAGESIASIARLAGMRAGSVDWRLWQAGVLNRTTPPNGRRIIGNPAATEAKPEPVRPKFNYKRMVGAGGLVLSDGTRFWKWAEDMEVLDRDGHILYATTSAGDVYELQPDRARRWYCRLVNWEQSRAYYRIAHPQKRLGDTSIPGPISTSRGLITGERI